MLESGPDDKPFGRIATLADPFGQLRNVGRAFLTVQTFTKVSGAPDRREFDQQAEAVEVANTSPVTRARVIGFAWNA